jgi:hypothetical protein
MKQWLAFALPWIGLAHVHAHDGHGLDGGGHWHVTDAVGFAIALVMVAAVWWLGRGK